MMGDVGKYGNYAVAAVFFIVGLHLIGLLKLPFAGAGNIGMQKKGSFAAFLLGLIFGIALGPCTFAYMAPILSLAFKVASANPLYAIALLTVYGIGHCTVIVLAGASAESVQNYLNWNEKTGLMRTVKGICGILVMMGGAYLIYTAG
jgi:cytochrome c-type biogenesis protein